MIQLFISSTYTICFIKMKEIISIEIRKDKDTFIINDVVNPLIILDKDSVYKIKIKNIFSGLYILDKEKNFKLNIKNNRTNLNTSNISGDIAYIQSETGLIRSKIKLE